MKVSQQGLNFIAKEEGTVLHVYLDQIGKPTIGIGHLLSEQEIQSNKFAHGITNEQALQLLAQDIQHTENLIQQFIHANLNQNQFDALASLVFNCGSAPIEQTLGKRINELNYDEIKKEWIRWCHAGQTILPVLQKRRTRELNLFLAQFTTSNNSNYNFNITDELHLDEQ